jgi:transcriptional regulator with XRE-family HTH domain
MEKQQFLRLIGRRIRSIRKAKKVSQERVAELAGLHPTYVSDIENGKVNASVASYYVVSRALDTPLSEIFNLPAGKADKELESDIAELSSLVRSLNKRNRSLFLSAAKGLISGLKK